MLIFLILGVKFKSVCDCEMFSFFSFHPAFWTTITKEEARDEVQLTTVCLLFLIVYILCSPPPKKTTKNWSDWLFLP